MTKTIRTADCLVVALSCLLVGCAKNLPELPELPNIYSSTTDIPIASDTPAPPQAAASDSPISAVDSGAGNEVTYAESSIKSNVDNSVDIVNNNINSNIGDSGSTDDSGDVGSSNPDSSYLDSKDSVLDFIANDLVKALSFISGLEPQLVSISAPENGSTFDGLVKQSMQQQGYRFDDNGFQSGSRQLTTSFAETGIASQVRELTAIMAINTALIRRTYLIRDDNVEQKSLYVIRGVLPSQVELNDQVSPL